VEGTVDDALAAALPLLRALFAHDGDEGQGAS
jgi:hypothetical protein